MSVQSLWDALFFFFKRSELDDSLSSRHPAPSVLIPALRTVGNIVTGDDLQTQVWTISFSWPL